MKFMGVDPGTEKHGWAVVWADLDGSLQVLDCGHGGPCEVEAVPIELCLMQVHHYPNIAVEVPVYQGPLRSGKHVLETAFRAGFFVGRLSASSVLPGEWRKFFFGKQNSSDAQVRAFVDSFGFRNLGTVRAKERPHIYDAICIALYQAHKAGYYRFQPGGYSGATTKDVADDSIRRSTRASKRGPKSCCKRAKTNRKLR